MADLRRIRSEISEEIDKARKAGRLEQYWRKLEGDVRIRWATRGGNGRSNGKSHTRKA